MSDDTCDQSRQTLLDLGWSASERQRFAGALRHLEGCDACRAAVRDYDRIGPMLESVSARADAGPPDGWGAFEARLERQVDDHAAAPPAPMRMNRRPRWPLALAASVVVGVLGFALGRSLHGPQEGRDPVGQQPPVTGSSGLATTVPFEPKGVPQMARAFGEMAEVYDRRAGWMLVSDQGSDVGLSPGPVDDADLKNVLLLRLTVTHSGAVASEADLMIVPGQAAELTVPLKEQGRSLHYRIATTAGDVPRLTLWLEVQTPQGEQTLAALATSLNVSPGQKVTAGQLQTSAGPYELKIGFARAEMPGLK